MISIVVIGAGQVGTHFCNAIHASSSLSIKQFYNRSKVALTDGIKDVEFCNDLDLLKDADLYLIAVSDVAVEAISKALPFENRLVVHTSGSVAMRFLSKKNRRGVFYPLQTFSKNSDLNFSAVPICIETSCKKDRELLKSVAIALGSPYYTIQTEQRQALHIAAVFVNNFTNQLYRIAHELTDSEGLEFDILKPLIAETANKVQVLSPYMAQTGPAKRNDKKTILRQQKLLENTPKFQEIYKLLTKSIQKTHG